MRLISCLSCSYKIERKFFPLKSQNLRLSLHPLSVLGRSIKPFFRLKGPGLAASKVQKMDLMAQTQEEVNKAPPPKPDVPTVFDLVQREQEIKLLDVKDKQVIDVTLTDMS
jgi:hypothetical protein